MSNRSTLLAEFADNTTNAIVPANFRDLVNSVVLTTDTNAGPLSLDGGAILTDGQGDATINGANPIVGTTAVPSLTITDTPASGSGATQSNVAIGDVNNSGYALSVNSGATALDGGLICTDGAGTLNGNSWSITDAGVFSGSAAALQYVHTTSTYTLSIGSRSGVQGTLMLETGTALDWYISPTGAFSGNAATASALGARPRIRLRA